MVPFCKRVNRRGPLRGSPVSKNLPRQTHLGLGGEGFKVNVFGFEGVFFRRQLGFDQAGLAVGSVGIRNGLLVHNVFVVLKVEFAKDGRVGAVAMESLSHDPFSCFVFNAADLFLHEKALLQKLGFGSCRLLHAEEFLDAEPRGVELIVCVIVKAHDIMYYGHGSEGDSSGCTDAFVKRGKWFVVEEVFIRRCAAEGDVDIVAERRHVGYDTFQVVLGR